MAETTQVTTLADLRRDLLHRVRGDTANTATTNIADRLLNEALVDVHDSPGAKFPWLERRDTLITHATYTTGTVAIAAATRTTVTGTSTLWNTAVTGFGFNNARAGGKMKFSNNEVYEVSTVGGDTSITLLTLYTGDALSAASYTYFEDEYSLASDFAGFIDARYFSQIRNIPLIGRQQARMWFPRNDVPSKPRAATLIQKAFSGSTSPAHRIVLYPPPDNEESFPYTYITTNLAVSSGGAEQTQMTADTDEPIIPLRYRHVLVFHALYHWYSDRKDDSRSKEAKAEYVDFMTRMTGDTQVGQDRPRFVMSRRRGIPPRGRFNVNGRFEADMDW